jgi:hypothetical protein
MTEQMDELISYVADGCRVSPNPRKWNELWNMLPDRRRQGSSWNPSPPLILAAWWMTSDLQKRDRLITHINYAADKGVLPEVDRFLRSLKQDEWVYEGDV